MIQIVNKEDFFNIIKTNKLVVVDFYADWCGPCKMMAPILEQIAIEMNGDLEIIKVNIDEESTLANQYSIMSIPTLLVFLDEDLVAKVTGFQQKEKIIATITKLIT